MRAIDADAMIDRLKEWDTKDKTDKALYNFTLNRINEQPTIQPDIVRCKDCKWWKDSDGVFRRGTGAESKCPLNLHQVYEGTFFCGLAERRDGTI